MRALTQMFTSEQPTTELPPLLASAKQLLRAQGVPFDLEQHPNTDGGKTTVLHVGDQYLTEAFLMRQTHTEPGETIRPIPMEKAVPSPVQRLMPAQPKPQPSPVMYLEASVEEAQSGDNLRRALVTDTLMKLGVLNSEQSGEDVQSFCGGTFYVAPVLAQGADL